MVTCRVDRLPERLYGQSVTGHFLSIWIAAQDADDAQKLLDDVLASHAAGLQTTGWTSEDTDEGHESDLEDEQHRYAAGVCVLGDVSDATGLAAVLHDRGFVIRAVPETVDLPAPTRTQISSGDAVTFDVQPVLGGFGGDDYERPDGLGVRITALMDGDAAGYAEMYLGPRHVRIVWLDVSERWQRRGIGRALLEVIEGHCGDWHTHGFTDEGIELMTGTGRSSRI